MSSTTTKITVEEFLKLPQDGIERWLINGEVWEFDPMPYRNRFHSRVVTRVSKFLDNWLDRQPEPRGTVLSGDAGVRLGNDIVGIDVVYLSPEVLAAQTEETTIIEGVPLLAVEVLSPSNTQEDINDKLSTFKRAGIALIWLVDPVSRTVTVHRLRRKPQMFNDEETLTAEPELPGFSVAVAQLFA
jgi:Uma2 family endonuclease